MVELITQGPNITGVSPAAVSILIILDKRGERALFHASELSLTLGGPVYSPDARVGWSRRLWRASNQ